MPSKDPAQRLQDIRENIGAIQSFIQNMTLDEYLKDRKTIYAVIRALEIISEASRRLPDEIKARYPDIDWRGLAGIGNVYRHGYDVVDQQLVWEMIHRRLEPLRKAVEAELRQTGR